jgi:hypothetical protein
VANKIYRGFDGARAGQLKALLYQKPRNVGEETSLWTLELAAEVSFEQGLTPERRTGQPRSGAHGLATAGCALEAGQAGDPEPRSSVCAKRRDRDRLIALAERHPEYALGLQDEVWWSRVTQPNLRAWVDADSA